MQLELNEKITSMLPDSDPYVLDFKNIIDNIPALETLYIDIENINACDNEQFIKASDIVFNKLKVSPYFIDIAYRFSNNEFMNLINMLGQKKQSLLNKSDIKKIDNELNQQNINKKLLDIKRNLLNPSGIFIVDRVIKDPLGFDKLVLEKLNTLKNETAGIKIKEGRIISNDEKHILIMATPAFPAVDTKKSKKMIDLLQDIRTSITKEFNGTIKTGFSGNHIATYDNSISIQKDVKRAVAILSIGIVSIGFLFFRRKVFILLIFLPTVISLTAAAALLSLVYSSVSAIALGCGSVLVGITVDFGIHILFSIDNNKKNSITKIIKNLRLPIATGAFTTMTAFTCLLFSSLPGQRQMGLFSLTGVLCAALFSSFLLRYFIPQIKEETKKPVISLISICKKLIALRNKYKRVLVVICLVLFGISLFGLKEFKFDGDISNLNHLSPVVKKDTDNFLKTWGGTSPAIVLVKGANLDDALINNDKLSTLLLKLHETGTINKIASLSPIFPSSLTREQNIRNWNNFMSEEKKDSIKRMLNKASLDLGFSKNTFQPFFNSLKEKQPELVMTDFQDTAINKLINEKIIIKTDHVLVMTTFNIKNRSKITNIRNKIKSTIPGSMFLDKKSFVENITSIVAKEFKRLLYFAAMGMIIALLLFMRNIKVVIVTVIPVFLSIIITAGILGFIGIAVNLISILFIIFVFGVGVDFSIFLINAEGVNKELSLSHKKSQQEAAVTQGAVILCAMTTIGAFISLIFARHAALFSIGVAGFTGMLTSLILAVILIPVLTETIIFKNKSADNDK